MTAKKNYSATTAAQFEIFKKEVAKWINVFGIKGWLVEFQWVDSGDTRAGVSWKMTGRICCVRLSRKWEERGAPISNDEIKRSAFHECCELFLSRLVMMAEGKICNNSDCVTEETHNVIRVLENVLFSWGKK